MRRLTSLVACLASVACVTTSANSPAPTPAPRAEVEPLDDLPLPPADFGDDAAPAEGTKPVLVFGMTRPTGAQAAIFSARALNGYLSAALGGQVKTRLFDDADVLASALASGAIDAAWLTPPAFVRAAERAAVRPLVRLSRGGFTSYRSVFFVKAASAAQKLEDLQGKSVVWVGPDSASGWLFPRAYLKRMGKDPKTFFAAEQQAPEHREACLAVLEGRADVGATLADEHSDGSPMIVDGCRSSGMDPKEFRIVATTEAIPNDVVATRADAPDALEEKLKGALLAMTATEDGKAQLAQAFKADGFAAVSEEDFAPVKALILRGN